MYISGVGTDIVEISRIGGIMERWGGKFLHRIFTNNELQYLQNKSKSFTESFAARFAAKEAVLKALGTGLRNCRWTDIEITTDLKTGRPGVVLHNKAEEIAKERNIASIYVSLSHSNEYALAFAVAERRDES